MLALALLVLLPVCTSAAVTDLRVAIDVSGSMKHNDPRKLRTPALRLLVGLIPEGQRAGVWTFGRYVNMQVRYGRVDARWKALARAEAERIHSRGLFTNIEEVLKKASFGWQRPDPRFRRHLLLLTDGMVDISKDPAVNRASRARILREILPRLKRAGVQVHTIALSANADLELLATLSRATGGWHEQVADADGLQRVFLRLFEKASPMDNLPLDGNRFRVDNSVTDMTLLVFRKPGSTPTALRTPQGGTWSAATHPASVKWFEEQGFDLVTVKQPPAGEWLLQAQVDPDNRVMVLTNLRLQLEPLPNVLLPGDRFVVQASLVQKGKRITSGGFLRLVRFGMELEPPAGASRPLALKDDGRAPDRRAADGIYSGTLGGRIQSGVHEIIVRARGATFERLQRHLVQVFDTAARIEVSKQADGRYRLRVEPHPGLLLPGSIAVSALRGDGSPVTFTRRGEAWEAVLAHPAAGEVVGVEIRGQRHDGRELVMSSDHPLTGGAPAPAPAPTPPGPDTDAAAEHAPETPPDEVEAVEAEAEEGADWLTVAIYVLVANVVLFGGGFGGWFLWRRLRRGKQAEEDAEVEV